MGSKGVLVKYPPCVKCRFHPILPFWPGKPFDDAIGTSILSQRKPSLHGFHGNLCILIPDAGGTAFCCFPKCLVLDMMTAPFPHPGPWPLTAYIPFTLLRSLLPGWWHTAVDSRLTRQQGQLPVHLHCNGGSSKNLSRLQWDGRMSIATVRPGWNSLRIPHQRTGSSPSREGFHSRHPPGSFGKGHLGIQNGASAGVPWIRMEIPVSIAHSQVDCPHLVGEYRAANAAPGPGFPGFPRDHLLTVILN